MLLSADIKSTFVNSCIANILTAKYGYAKSSDGKKLSLIKFFKVQIVCIFVCMWFIYALCLLVC